MLADGFVEWVRLRKSVSPGRRFRAWRRRSWIGEVRLSNRAGHRAAVDIRQDGTSLSTELYQVILRHALTRSQVERSVSIVPTLPAAPVVPALYALIGIAGLGN